jgi:S1-C subfamily serine protease
MSKKILAASFPLLCGIAAGQIDFKPIKTPTEIARAAFPSVVLLVMNDARGQPLSLGSGFFIEKDTIVTNVHVIDGVAGGYAKVIGQPAKLNVEGVVGLDAALAMQFSPSGILEDLKAHFLKEL